MVEFAWVIWPALGLTGAGAQALRNKALDTPLMIAAAVGVAIGQIFDGAVDDLRRPRDCHQTHRGITSLLDLAPDQRWSRGRDGSERWRPASWWWGDRWCGRGLMRIW